MDNRNKDSADNTIVEKADEINKNSNEKPESLSQQPDTEKTDRINEETEKNQQEQKESD